MEANKRHITVMHTGQTFACREDEFVLEAMRRAGCGPVRYGCFGGGCGVCKMRILSGDYYIEKKMSRAHVTQSEQESGTVLICCVKPRSDMEIEQV